MKSNFAIPVGLLSLFLLVWNHPADAEGACPSGYYQTSPQGVAGPIGCAPIPSSSTAPKWASRWGAIAKSSTTVGISANMKDERTASAEALSGCREQGGIDCEIQQTYSNQCVAIVTSSSFSTRRNASTKDKAIADAIAWCRKESRDKNCKIYYSGCSLPVRVQ